MPAHPELQVVSIETVDTAVHGWLDATVDAHVVGPTGERKKVPVIFSSGERFATGRTERGIRDSHGVLVLPLISIRRISVDPDPSMQALGVETPGLTFARRIDATKTNLLRNLEQSRSLSNRVDPQPVYEVWTVPFPDRSVLVYELQVQAQFTTQMNSILEKIFDSLEFQKSFLATFEPRKQKASGEKFSERQPPSGGYVVGFMDDPYSDDGNLDDFTDQERIIRWTSTIRVPASLQLDTEGRRPAAQVERTSFGLRFGKESVHFVDDPAELDRIFGKLR